jgi:hypothetical protein
VRGSIHSYYTKSQSRSQNPGNSIILQMAERIKKLETEREQHRAKMEEVLASHLKMAKLIEQQNAQMEAKDSMVDAHFC